MAGMIHEYVAVSMADNAASATERTSGFHGHPSPGSGVYQWVLRHRGCVVLTHLITNELLFAQSGAAGPDGSMICLMISWVSSPLCK